MFTASPVLVLVLVLALLLVFLVLLAALAADALAHGAQVQTSRAQDCLGLLQLRSGWCRQCNQSMIIALSAKCIALSAAACTQQ